MGDDKTDGLLVDVEEADDQMLLDLGEDTKTEPKPKAAAKTPEKTEAKAVEADESAAALEMVAKVKKQLAAAEATADAERRARADAENRARAAGEAVKTAEAQVRLTELDAILNAKMAAAAQGKEARAAYQAALEGGDFAKAADAQEKIARTAALMLRYEEAEDAAKAKEEAAKREAPQQRQAAQNADPFETYVSQFTPKTQAWWRAHPEYATNKKLNFRVLAAHEEAVENGLKPDTDDYFAHVETVLGLREQAQEEAEDEEPAEEAPPKKTRVVAAAPVSRGGGGPNAALTRITLTRAEADAAEAMGLTKEEYAASKLELIKSGQMPAN